MEVDGRQECEGNGATQQLDSLYMFQIASKANYGNNALPCALWSCAGHKAQDAYKNGLLPPGMNAPPIFLLLVVFFFVFSDKMKNHSVLCVIFFGLISSAAATQEHDGLWANCGLQEDYYQRSCPKAEAIIAHLLAAFVRQDVKLPAKLLRMHFHDCFVRGCDASVLLYSTKNNKAEKDAVPNDTLEGYEIIDKLKAALEKECPGVVSCADIIAYAARESAFLAGLGNRYKVKGGRKDGKISRASEAVQNLPPPTFNVDSLIKIFASKGLSTDDMVTLSGAHSIGVSHCPSLSGRQFSNYPPQSPLHLDSIYAAKLRKMCPKSGKTVSELFMDAYTPVTLDNKYYLGLLHRKGLFPSDATLLTKSTTQKLVETYAQDRHYWASKFAAAMIKMGEVQVKTGNQGEVRRTCSRVN